MVLFKHPSGFGTDDNPSYSLGSGRDEIEREKRTGFKAGWESRIHTTLSDIG